MKLISHRGNINGINQEKENTTDYIDLAISYGYDVEIDTWIYYGEIYLGHDEPQYYVDVKWLLDRKDNLWIHTKDIGSLDFLMDYDLRLFFHKHEDHTIIYNTKNIWSHDLNNTTKRSIIPLLSYENIKTSSEFKDVYGICSDYISIIK